MLSQAEPKLSVAAAGKHALVSSNATRMMIGGVIFMDSILSEPELRPDTRRARQTRTSFFTELSFYG
jgi:hypothetical protein